jgi:hypothetical protein
VLLVEVLQLRNDRPALLHFRIPRSVIYLREHIDIPDYILLVIACESEYYLPVLMYPVLTSIFTNQVHKFSCLKLRWIHDRETNNIYHSC